MAALAAGFRRLPDVRRLGCQMCQRVGWSTVHARGNRLCERCVGPPPRSLEWPDRLQAAPRPVRQGARKITRRYAAPFLEKLREIAEAHGLAVESTELALRIDADAARLLHAFEADAGEIRLRVVLLAPEEKRAAIERLLERARALAETR